MSYFFLNIVTILYVFSIWCIAGWGFSALLLKQSHKAYTFLMAPLMGMCLLTLIGIFQITVLLTPFTPLLILSFLIAVSGIYFWKNRKTTRKTLYFIQKHFAKFLFLPFILLLVFAWLFHTQGFELFVGSTDQLQYAEDARHIVEIIHTGSAQDLPVPRQKYFVYEMQTRILPYLVTYRRGAEIVLGTTAKISGLSYENAFPLTIICSLLTLGFALVVIGKLFLKLSNRGCIALQAIFLSSFYFLLMHVQGSLALLLSLPFWLMSLSLLSCIGKNNLKLSILTVIMIAAYVGIYTEPGLLSLIIPSVIFVLWNFRKSLIAEIKGLTKLIIIYLLVLLCNPFGVYSVIQNALGHTSVVYSNSHGLFSGIHLSSILALAKPLQIAGPVLGIYTYYATSNINNFIAQTVANMPWACGLIFILLASIGLLGLFKAKSPLARLSAIILMLWASVSILVSIQQDYLRVMRSIEYAMPFIMIGIVLLAFGNRYFLISKTNYFGRFISRGGKLVFTSFIFINVYTSYVTISYISNHMVSDDSILVRFDEEKFPWKQIKSELSSSALKSNPILISGFQETVRPFAFAVLLRTQPHFLGDSMNFWAIYNDFNYLKGSKNTFQGSPLSRFNTKISKQDYLAAINKENTALDVLRQDMLQQSTQALVPVNHGYPTEWNSFKDIYTPHVVHFKNIGDIVYKNKYDLYLPANMVSELKKDKEGNYRMLFSSGPINVVSSDNNLKALTINFEGKPNDIQLLVKGQIQKDRVIEKNNKVSIKVEIKPEDKNTLKLIVRNPVKLRNLSLETV